MEKKKGARGRGRPRKNPVKPVQTGPKRGRGRPSKKSQVTGSENIVVSSDIPIVEEVYKEPKLLRKKRVFRLDRTVFHTLANTTNGDIIKMSYIVNELMRLYNEKKIKINWKLITPEYYYNWCKGCPPIEPLVADELAQAHAVSHGTSLKYKYPLIIDETTFYAFERSAEKYYPFVINKLLQMYFSEDNKVFMDRHIKLDKAKDWCDFEK